MSDNKALKRMKELQASNKHEENHVEADGILCMVLRANGYDDLVDEFSKLTKWYS